MSVSPDPPLKPSVTGATVENQMAPNLAQVAFGERRFGAVNWLGLWTLYKKEVHRYLKVMVQTIFPPIIQTVLYLFVFKFAFGAARGEVLGVPYLEFLAPGLVMMAVMTNAFSNSSSSVIISKVQGTSVDFLMPPLSPAELTTAFVAGAASRGIMVGLVTIIACAVFMAFTSSPMHLSNILLVLYFAIGAATLFGAIGVIGGMWAEKFDQLSIISTFVITPLTFLSGTFYAISRLPEPILTFTKFNPVFYMIDGFRAGFIGTAEGSIWIGIVYIGVLNAILIALTYRLFKSGYKLKS